MQKSSILSAIPAQFICLALLTMPTQDAEAISVISSSFDTDDDGWLATGDSTSVTPTYLSSGGNPGGTIEVDDNVVGGVWYYQAPDKFLNDKSLAYNQTLSFDLWQKHYASTTLFESSDVVLKGAGLILTINAGATPAPWETWVGYSVLLKEGVGWQKVSTQTSLVGTDATQAEIQAVLASLDQLLIRGEFITGADTGRLDNVNMTLIPIPSALYLFGTGLLGLVGMAKRKKAA